MNQKQELEIVIKESGLEKSQGDVILESFTSFIKQFNELEALAKEIVITDISQKEDMFKARETRLALKTIRVNAENTRKLLKEKALREGKAIDGIANIVKALIVPVEEYLESQEKFIENIETAKRNKMIEERTASLSLYVEDISVYNFYDLSDEAFENLISQVKSIYDAKQAELKKIEDKRIADEKAAKEEAEKNKIEVEKLRKEKEERDIKEAKEKKEREEKAAKEKAIADAKLKEEQDARIKLEKEIKDKEIAELKKKQEEEARIKAENEAREKAKREAELAPEKDKLIAYAESIRMIKSPDGLSKVGLEVVKTVEAKLLAISQEIKLKVKEL